LPSPSEVFRARLREVRRVKGLTQPELSEALASVGVDLNEFVITRIESGKRRVTLDEAVALAAVLGPSLLHMLIPVDDTSVHLAPEMPERAIDARAWIRGQRPLRRADEQLFFFQTPPSEADWFPFVPGPWRSEDPQTWENARPRYEREILRRGALPRGRDLEDGPDAKDIEVARPENADEEQKEGR
jgi:transcriptional regulator with XRE-family HTH domain